MTEDRQAEQDKRDEALDLADLFAGSSERYVEMMDIIKVATQLVAPVMEYNVSDRAKVETYEMYIKAIQRVTTPGFVPPEPKKGWVIPQERFLRLLHQQHDKAQHDT